MKISRRNFVGTASCAAAGAFCSIQSLNMAGVNSGNSRSSSASHFAVLDLQSRCVLPESLAGYRLALADAHHAHDAPGSISLTELELRQADAHRAIILPAVGTIGDDTATALLSALNSGTTVIWESGAAFLNSSDFAAHQSILRDHFAITIAPPKNLWLSNPSSKSQSKSVYGRSTAAPHLGKLAPTRPGHEQVPYINYHWPHETRVRDFTRAIPVSAKTGRAVAHLGDLSVAWRKPIGRGTFIFLGSPIGPALRAGDAEANSWLRAVISVPESAQRA
jgi:hypothetical protein